MNSSAFLPALSRLALAALLAVLVPAALLADEPDDATPPAKGVIAWETSFATATKKAEAEQKPLLFKFYTGWCPHCTRMDKTTWLDANVATAAASFVSAKVNADVEKVPVTKYRLTGYPTVIVAEPGGEQVLRLEGYKDATAIAGYLKAYLADEVNLDKAYTALRADRKNAAALLSIGSFYAKVALHDQAADTFLKALKSAQGADLVAASAGAGTSLVALKKSEQAVKVLQQGLAAAGEQPPPALLLALGQAEAAQGRPDQAKEWYGKVVAQHPDSLEADTARRELGQG